MFIIRSPQGYRQTRNANLILDFQNVSLSGSNSSDLIGRATCFINQLESRASRDLLRISRNSYLNYKNNRFKIVCFGEEFYLFVDKRKKKHCIISSPRYASIQVTWGKCIDSKYARFKVVSNLSLINRRIKKHYEFYL